MPPKFRVVLYRGWYYAAWQEGRTIRRKALRTQHRESAEQTLKLFETQFEIANRPEIITVEYVWNGYRETLKGRPSFQTMGFEAGPILRFFGALPAGNVTESECNDYIGKRRAEGRNHHL